MIKTKLTAAEQMKKLMESVGWGAPAPVEHDRILDENGQETFESRLARYEALAEQMISEEAECDEGEECIDEDEDLDERKAPQVEEAAVMEDDMDARMAHYDALADQLMGQGGEADAMSPAGARRGPPQYNDMESMPMMEKYQRYLKARMK